MNDEGIVHVVRPYTLLSRERIQNVLDCIEQLEKDKIEGDLVEIGVYKGGVIMAMALKCQQLNSNRKIYAYDTYEGMTQPTENDIDCNFLPASDMMHESKIMCYSSLEETKRNVEKTEYNNVVFCKGDIVKTDTSTIPQTIALLRLDTDWYESTTFELQHFEPHVPKKGFVIIDDYGHWQGSRKATDEFLSKNPSIHPIPIDYTGVYWRKE